MDNKTMRGCDELREWLIARRFKCFYNDLEREREVNWYACRKTEYTTRECECNEGKAMQLVIRPFSYSDGNQRGERAQVEVIGGAHGLWFNLSA